VPVGRSGHGCHVPTKSPETRPETTGSDDDRRKKLIVDTLVDAFSDLMEADSDAFRVKFRKMAADPWAFYRGSACIFYADMAEQEDHWAEGDAGRVWIQGDLHAENFGTYMDGKGALVFDVNDFDEAYLGPFTWDLRRFVASLALMCWQKALPDTAIDDLCERYLRAYVEHVNYFVENDRDHEWALRLDTAEGAVHKALQQAQLSTRIELLDRMTVVEDYRRRFRHSSATQELGRRERRKVEKAYESYLKTIPESKRMGSISYTLKDVVATSGFGIGSAGLPAYNLLVEGHTQALENDIVLSMKQGNVAAPSRVVSDREAEEFFQHHGHRTAVSQSALQAHADPWLGWTEIGGTGYVVAEVSPYDADLDWSEISEPKDLAPVVEQLGRATAKVHCVSDKDSGDTPLVDFQTEDVVAEAISDVDGFVKEMVEFAHSYADRARADHHLFVTAFRSDEIPGVSATTTS
jgi:uncharacterized protein (DUF2252 family)